MIELRERIQTTYTNVVYGIEEHRFIKFSLVNQVYQSIIVDFLTSSRFSIDNPVLSVDYPGLTPINLDFQLIIQVKLSKLLDKLGCSIENLKFC